MHNLWPIVSVCLETLETFYKSIVFVIDIINSVALDDPGGMSCQVRVGCGGFLSCRMVRRFILYFTLETVHFSTFLWHLHAERPY